MPLFSAGKRVLVTTGSAGRPRYPGFQAKRFWKQWLPVAREYWAGNERLLGGGGVQRGADKRYLAGLRIDLAGPRMKLFFLNAPHLSSTKLILEKHRNEKNPWCHRSGNH